jgi:catechol 2,3-dioxygenase-like lactoylglutathione lyase family enzyme
LNRRKEKPAGPRLCKAWRAASILCGVLLAPASVLDAQTPQRPHIMGLAHIALYVHDVQKSRAFYGGVLGFQEPFSAKSTSGPGSITFYKINDHQYIELFPEVQQDSDRLKHISLETDDIEALRLYLASKGVQVPSHAELGSTGNLKFNIIDPAGHSIELMQYMPNGLVAKNYGKYMSDGRVSKHMTHVGVIVTQLDAEYKFYTEILGFKETWRGSSSGTILSWINLKVPDGSDYVEFMLNNEGPTASVRGNAHHLCLLVPDVAVNTAKLKGYSNPVELRLGINRKRQANLFDPDGTRTELMEPGTIDGKPTPSSTAPWTQ